VALPRRLAMGGARVWLGLGQTLHFCTFLRHTGGARLVATHVSHVGMVGVLGFALSRSMTISCYWLEGVLPSLGRCLFCGVDAADESIGSTKHSPALRSQRSLFQVVAIRHLHFFLYLNACVARHPVAIHTRGAYDPAAPMLPCGVEAIWDHKRLFLSPDAGQPGAGRPSLTTWTQVQQYLKVGGVCTPLPRPHRPVLSLQLCYKSRGWRLRPPLVGRGGGVAGVRRCGRGRSAPKSRCQCEVSLDVLQHPFPTTGRTDSLSPALLYCIRASLLVEMDRCHHSAQVRVVGDPARGWEGACELGSRGSPQPSNMDGGALLGHHSPSTAARTLLPPPHTLSVPFTLLLLVALRSCARPAQRGGGLEPARQRVSGPILAFAPP
jgi:hypothetical protein